MLRILKPLRYVFYRILSWKLRDPRETTPVLVAGMATALLLFFNFLFAFMVANILMGHRVLPTQRLGNVEYVALGALFLMVVSMFNSAWVADGKFAELEKEFANGTPAQETVRTVLLWVYVISSAAMPVALAILWHATHR